MTIRIGIIGSGFAAQHVLALDKIKEAKLVAICSLDEKGAKKIIQGKDNVTYYPFEAHLNMLKKEKLDAVYVCLPPFLHGELELKCSEYVKAMFIEKPVTLNLEEGTKLLHTFEKAGTIVSTGYMNRYRKNIQMAKTYFAKEKPVLINSAWCGEMPPPFWWRQRKMSGGQLTEQCTHFIDAIRYIAGEVDEVSAYANKGFIDDVADFNVDDAIVMNLRLKSGAIGNVMTSCFTKDHGGGALGLFVNFASREKTYRFSNHSMDLEIQHANYKLEALPSQEDVMFIENKAFIDAIINNDQCLILSTYDEALETVKVGFAADLSIKEKRVVKLSEL